MQLDVSKTHSAKKFPENKKLPTDPLTQFLEAKMMGTKHFCPFHLMMIFSHSSHCCKKQQHNSALASRINGSLACCSPYYSDLSFKKKID